jgi:hypothetical protein
MVISPHPKGVLFVLVLIVSRLSTIFPYRFNLAVNFFAGGQNKINNKDQL